MIDKYSGGHFLHKKTNFNENRIRNGVIFTKETTNILLNVVDTQASVFNCLKSGEGGGPGFKKIKIAAGRSGGSPATGTFSKCNGTLLDTLIN